MPKFNSKEKLKNALNHKEGQIPIDFGSTAVTGIHVKIVEELRLFYGLSKKPVKVIEPYQMLGEVDDELKTILKIDTEGCRSYSNIFGFQNSDYKLWRTPWGQEVLVPKMFEVEQKGKDIFIFPQGDRTVLPSGRMPRGGYFFDAIVRQPPLDDENLNVADNLEEFCLLKGEELKYYESETERAYLTSKSVIAGAPGTALGDIALVPAPFLKYPKGIRDITEWYISTVTRQDYIHKIFAYQTDIAIQNLVKLKEVIGNKIDVIVICGTDFGTQNGTFCSPKTYDQLWHPYYKKINDWIHTNTEWKTFKHSCGAVYNFIDHFINSGFDILNPVQCSAAEMSPEKLKTTFGDRIVFWGGGVDTQKTLPFGTPQQVKKEVLSRCEIFSKNGGFVFNSIHNIQANTPFKNIIAMFEAVNEFNG